MYKNGTITWPVLFLDPRAEDGSVYLLRFFCFQWNIFACLQLSFFSRPSTVVGRPRLQRDVCTASGLSNRDYHLDMGWYGAGQG